MLTNQKILKRPKLLLYNATEQGDINRVREILSSLQQREQISEDEYETSIMAAAHNGNIEIAREIFSAKQFSLQTIRYTFNICANRNNVEMVRVILDVEKETKARHLSRISDAYREYINNHLNNDLEVNLTRAIQRHQKELTNLLFKAYEERGVDVPNDTPTILEAQRLRELERTQRAVYEASIHAVKQSRDFREKGLRLPSHVAGLVATYAVPEPLGSLVSSVVTNRRKEEDQARGPVDPRLTRKIIAKHNARKACMIFSKKHIENVGLPQQEDGEITLPNSRKNLTNRI